MNLKKRLDDLEKVRKVKKDPDRIRIVEVYAGHGPEAVLLETWDLETGERICHERPKQAA